MRFRLVVPPLLVAAALAFAYAVPAPSSHPSEATRAAARRLAAGGDTVEARLDVTVGETVEFNLHVTNSSPKRVELRFPNGKTHDVAVLDAQGREVWRWSEGRMFTQAMQNKVLGASDTLTFSETWHPQAAGSYTAVASLLSENFPVEQRVGFSLPGKAVSIR
jgi:hypothetical protein